MPKLFRRIVRKGSCADRLWTADKFFHRVDDREFRPPVSVEVSMRETKRTRQQAYPDISCPLLYGGGSTNLAWFRFPVFWEPVFALLIGSFPRIYSVVTFP